MTPQQIDAMKLALDALKQIDEAMPFPVAKLAQKAIREALAQPEQEQKIGCVNHDCDQCKAQPEQEPVAWMDADGNVSDNNDHKCFPIPLYTTPPQRKPLTVWEIELWAAKPINRVALCRAIEAAHGIKENT